MKDQFFKQEGINLTYMPAITEATAKALKAYPLVNSSVDGYNIILKKPINIGIAVSLNDGNLIVPVIHDADKLNLSGLASQIDTLAAKAVRISSPRIASKAERSRLRISEPSRVCSAPRSSISLK